MMKDISTDDIEVDPWPIYTYLRKNAPVYWSRIDKIFFLTKYEQIAWVLKNSNFSVSHPFGLLQRVFDGVVLLSVDGQRHKHMRKLLEKPLTPNIIKKYEEIVIKPIAEEVLLKLHGRKNLDVITDLALKIPTRIIAQLMGIPDKDSDWLYRNIQPILKGLNIPIHNLDGVVPARQKINEYLNNLFEQKNFADNTIMSYLLNMHEEGQVANKKQLLRFTLMYLLTGTETTIASIGNMFKCLLQHPDTWQILKKDQSMIGTVVREILRFEPPSHMSMRFPKKDTEIDGIKVKSGTPVQIFFASANRDECEFQQANSWCLYGTKKKLVSFGIGHHGCIGGHFATRQLEIVLGMLIKHIKDIELAIDTIPASRGLTFRYPPDLPINVTWAK